MTERKFALAGCCDVLFMTLSPQTTFVRLLWFAFWTCFQVMNIFQLPFFCNGDVKTYFPLRLLMKNKETVQNRYIWREARL